MPLSAAVTEGLVSILGPNAVLTKPEDIIPYGFDGTAALRQSPGAVIFPQTTDEVARCVQLAAARSLPIVTRGSGTGLSGGSVPDARQSRSLSRADEQRSSMSIRATSRCGRSPASITLTIDEAAARHGLFYPPDPGSMRISTIGGNVAENSGGLRGLKYGVTRDYVMALEVVLPDGRVARFGNTASRTSPATR